MIRAFQVKDLDACADLLIDAYNPEPWRNHWTHETACKYLSEFAEVKNFVGLVICEKEDIIGAMFAHIKTWWTNDELFVDEIYVKPECQGKGYGTALLKAGEEYARSRGLAGLTLLTNQYMPSKAFYEKRGYVHAQHVIFMYKEFQQGDHPYSRLGLCRVQLSPSPSRSFAPASLEGFFPHLPSLVFPRFLHRNPVIATPVVSFQPV